MKALALGAFVLDGVAAVAYVAAIALGDRHMSPLSGLVLVALLAGFICALAAVVRPEDGAARDEETATLLIAGAAMFDNLSPDAKEDVRQHFPERRNADRRRGERATHAGPDRRAGSDRRETAKLSEEVGAAIDQELAHSPS